MPKSRVTKYSHKNGQTRNIEKKEEKSKLDKYLPKGSTRYIISGITGDIETIKIIQDNGQQLGSKRIFLVAAIFVFAMVRVGHANFNSTSPLVRSSGPKKN